MSVKISGLPETMKRFERWPRAMLMEVQEKVLRKAARPVVNAAKATSPVREGIFRDSIEAILWPKKGERTTLHIAMAIVGASRKTQYQGRANIAHLLERGWRLARGGTLARESGKTAANSAATGERGKGVAVGYREGWHMFERAAASAGAESQAIIAAAVPTVAARVWKKNAG